jgi:eukaryotic-like serine/threonine-protein kinase
MRFGLLGLLDVADDGAAVPIGAGKESALLAILLLHANEPVSTDRLADGLWNEHQPANANKTIQVYVSRLRKRLGPERLITTAGGYVLRTRPDELDIERFEQLTRKGRQALDDGLPEQANRLLAEALDLWRGPPLADFRLDPFAQIPIRRLEELREAAAADRVDARLAIGETEELLPELEALVRESPLRERPRAQLMLCLYRCRRQAEALDLYQATRAALVEELGIEPSQELRDLHLAILRQDAVLDAAARRQTLRATRRGAFVGREAELTELDRGLDDAFAGRGRLFVLVGEPGIGKTRLAEEVVAAARARDAHILVGRCWEAGGAPAYWPWVQSLRSYVRQIDSIVLEAQLGAGACEIAQILPELREVLPDLPEPSSPDPEAARFRLFDAVAEFLRNASQARPLLLFLDDLHAADAPSLLLVQFLARELASMRVLVLGACRDVAPTPGHALSVMLTEVAREPLSSRIVLSGLDERDVAQYLELTAAKIASTELAAALHLQTQGNPLFVTETVRLVALEGLPPESAAAPLAVPQSVRDVIARRLGHLSPECNRVLELASILGREFDLNCLGQLSDLSQSDLLDLLDEAIAARVVSDRIGTRGRLRFAHVLIRDTLYDTLARSQRIRLHGEALHAMEALYGESLGPYLAELAHHSIAGETRAKAVEYSRRAGDRALTLLAYEEAARQYETALEMLDTSTASAQKTRCDLLLSLGEAEARAGNRQAAKTAFLSAADSARTLGLRHELARAAAGYGGRTVWARAGGDQRLVPLLNEALAVLEDDDVVLRVRLLARLSGALRDEHSRERRAEVSGEALELARRTGNDVALAYALEGRGGAIAGPDTLAECIAVGRELAEVAARTGDSERIAHGHLDSMFTLVLNDLHSTEAALEPLTRIAEELRQPVQLWQAFAFRAMLALAQGRLAEGNELVEQAFAFGERAQPEMAIAVHNLHRYALCDFRGCLHEVEPQIRNLVATHPTRPVFRCVLAHVLARLGETAAGGHALDEFASTSFSSLPFDMEWLYGMSLLAETAVLLDENDASARLYELLLPWEELSAVDFPEGHRGSIARYLGMLAAMRTGWDDAEGHFRRALTVNEAMNARPWTALTQQDYARMLLDRGRPGDGEHARHLLTAALTTYRELGMNGYTASAEALLES